MNSPFTARISIAIDAEAGMIIGDFENYWKLGPRYK
jgi:hypothetical protein